MSRGASWCGFQSASSRPLSRQLGRGWRAHRRPSLAGGSVRGRLEDDDRFHRDGLGVSAEALALRLRPTRMSSSRRSSAWMHGAPCTPPTHRVGARALLGQPRVAEHRIRRHSALPPMKRRPVDPQDAAHHGDGIVRLLRGDQRVGLAYRPSSAKKTALFARSPAPSANVTFSSRSRRSSPRSSLEVPPGAHCAAFSSLSP